MPLYEYIGNGKKYKYNHKTIHALMFDMEMEYLINTCNKINKMIIVIKRTEKKVSKLKN